MIGLFCFDSLTLQSINGGARKSDKRGESYTVMVPKETFLWEGIYVQIILHYYYY